MTLVVLTGATRGIGQAAAVALAAQGVELALVGRERERVAVVAEEARAAGANGVSQYTADLTLMSEVRALAADLREHHARIDVLANNAGAVFSSRGQTAEGLERTFALNHLAPFLLSELLRDRLAGGQVLTTASDAHKGGSLDLEDLQSERGYSAMRVYGTSKLCNIMFTRELARRAPELRANCFHPGVVRTGFGKNEGGLMRLAVSLAGPFLRSPAWGARSLVWLATDPAAAALDGEYVCDEKVVTPSAQACDETLAEALWEKSEELVAAR
jgi:NAD(P)-dependent dehydrogenase (short-subunit alcohol dehydrogenase family)